MDKTSVILCDKCSHNRGQVIDIISSFSGIAECLNCSNSVIIYFLKRQNIEEDTNI